MLFRNNKVGAKLRFGLVLVTLGVITFCYYSFSQFVHDQHFHHGGQEPHHDDHRHGGGPFEGIYLKKDGLFLYGLALPLAVLAVITLIWNPRSSSGNNCATMGTTGTGSSRFSAIQANFSGDVNVKKWAYLLFVIPLFLIMFDSSFGHFSGSRSQAEKQMNWTWWNSVLTSFMSPTGYAAVWALAAFLVPVTKHSPILDWLQVTPVQALAIHRVTGWTSLWCSIAHGILHLRHLLNVLRIHQEPRNSWFQELWILLVPPSWECIGRQNPFAFWMTRHHHQEEEDEQLLLDDENDDQQCWLALVNATGMVSVLAFVCLAITSLPMVRRSFYGLFYMTHIPMAWTMLFMAIWHYPTCALVLIPNILYYLSFNIPVCVTQQAAAYYSRCCCSRKKKSALLEANLIQDGAIELIFATRNHKDDRRHESRFVRLSHPAISTLGSHPFSVFSRQDLSTNDDSSSSSSSTTVSILLRPTGPFTKGLAKELFPDNQEEEQEDSSMASVPLIASHPPQQQLQVDSFYAGSFGWLDHAMESHDEILLIAGGVGIAPFLEFLPVLQQRILHRDNNIADVTTSQEEDDVETSSFLAEDSNMRGPKCIHLHWYCRQVGLVSYVWYNLGLGQHVQQAWNNNSSICHGRLKIHVHLTSMVQEEEDEETVIPISGLVKRHSYHHHDVYTVKDTSRIVHSSWYKVLPGSIMVFGTLCHWWWYKRIIIKDQFRHDNLIMRGHSIIWTLLFAVLLSIVFVALDTASCSRKKNAAAVAHQEQSVDIVEDPQSTTIMEQQQGPSCHDLKVSKGRPAVQIVTREIVNANQPGVYMCGPQALMTSIERQFKHPNVAFYRESSEL